MSTVHIHSFIVIGLPWADHGLPCRLTEHPPVRQMRCSQDCVLLPVVHTTAEELADYIVQEVIKELGPSLSKRCCEWLEIQVSERPGQAGCSTTYLSRSACP